MKKWEVARYLIDAKKDVDSIIFICENQKRVPVSIIKDYIERTKNDFYINCCNVLDEYAEQKGYFKNKELKDQFKHADIIERIYHERDKNSAHIDDKYEFRKYNDMNEIAEEMKCQIRIVKKTVNDILPTELTLNFIPHDKILFRMFNGLDHAEEQKIRNDMYTDRRFIYQQNKMVGKQISVIYDIKELRGMPNEEKKEKGVVCEVGLNYYESLQNLQDFFIIINTLFDLNYWTDFIKDKLPKYLELKNSGIIDQYDRPKKLLCLSKSFVQKTYDLAMDIYGVNIFETKENK